MKLAKMIDHTILKPEAGAARLGTSSGIAVVREENRCVTSC